MYTELEYAVGLVHCVYVAIAAYITKYLEGFLHCNMQQIGLPTSANRQASRET